ncbi:unnamed protein product, partial [Cuscuta europaea]
MDNFNNCSVENAKHPSGNETLMYFMNTMHDMKIMVVVVTQTNVEECDCETSQDWKQFLRALGCYRLLPTNFRNKAEIEHKLSHFVRR